MNDSEQKLWDMVGGNQHAGGGHSDHRAWGGSGIHEPSDTQSGSLERDVERQIFDAKQALESKGSWTCSSTFSRSYEDMDGKAKTQNRLEERTLRNFLLHPILKQSKNSRIEKKTNDIKFSTCECCNMIPSLHLYCICVLYMHIILKEKTW